MKPAVAADRKRVRPLGAVVAGADLGTFRHAGDVFSDPDKTAGSDLIAGSRLLWISVTLAGCSGGDFGRARYDVLNDDMHRWIGAEATSSIGLRPSQFQLTDNERLLRDLAYPLIEPPHSRPAWKSVFGNDQPLPAPCRQQVVFDRPAYGPFLIDEPH